MRVKKMEISDRVVQRLTDYLSILKEVRKDKGNINSIELAQKMNRTSAQVRKDLSTFGEFGVRGKGYFIEELIDIIENILGINELTNAIIIGHGKMGEMLSTNSKVLGKGFKIVGIFDKDEKKIGKAVSEELNLKIDNIENIRKFIEDYPSKIETAILCVVREQAQVVAEKLVENGIKAILNMTTYKLELGEDIVVVNVDISAKLQELNFWRLNRKTVKN